MTQFAIRFVLTLLCFYGLIISASSNGWIEIENHYESILLNLVDEVSSIQEAKSICEEKKGIVLVLWRKKVLNFLNNFLSKAKGRFFLLIITIF